MKIQILGTAAYERVPAMFCECAICNYARLNGGKEVRTQAQTLINDDLLVDFGQDNFYHFLKFNVDFKKIKNILITHSHGDHFVPDELVMTKSPYGHNNIEYNIFGGRDCYEKFNSVASSSKAKFNIVEPYQTFEVGRYTVTALPARHGTENPYIYIISDGDKYILYDHDSGIEHDEVYDYLEKSGIVFDLVISDCTNGYKHFDFIHSHKSFKDNAYHKDRLEKSGNVTDKTVWIITHFSHNGLIDKNGAPVSNEDLSRIASEMGMVSAYDGFEIEV